MRNVRTIKTMTREEFKRKLEFKMTYGYKFTFMLDSCRDDSLGYTYRKAKKKAYNYEHCKS